MASVGDIFEVVDTAEMNGQKLLNVYFYRAQGVSVTDNDSASVVTAFIDTVLPDIVAFQEEQVVHTSIKARNLFDDSDAHEELISVAGGNTGHEVLGTFEAVGYRLVGNNAAVRSGAKRYPGIGEYAVTDGVISDEGIIAILNTLAATLFADLPWGLLAAEILIPVIVQRIKVGSEYTLPTNQGEAVYSHVTDTLWSPIVTSQVSRKIGRGE